MLEANADLNTLKLLTRNLLDLYASYFKMTNMRDTTKLLLEASQEVEKLTSKTELQDLLEELIRYSGRLHYWIEPMMPWEDIIRTFESATS